MSQENDQTSDRPAGDPDAPEDGGGPSFAEGEATTTLSDADAAGANVEDLVAPMREERDRLKDQLLRTAADYENFRKRTRKDVDDAERRGKEDTVRELLPVFDNLERAVASSQNAKDVNSIVEGLRMVLKLFEDHVSRLGVTRVATVGERFDPAVHDAIQQKETDEHAPGTVIGEIVPGYKLGERLVRPALVVVARKPAASG
jgi:molecular chaperone GrpE